MTKIDIISGFLGAGKTTFIKKMLSEVFKGQKVVLIENEFGEVGVDGGFLKDTGIQITEMNSGCICCTLVGDFDRNLREVIAKYNPDRIIIEPSGVGKLSDVMTSVIKLEEPLGVKLNGLVTVVNAAKAAKQLKGFGEFFSNQIQYATTVVLSRTQTASEAVIEACVKMIQELNTQCAIITTPWDSITGAKLLEVMEGQDNLASEMKDLANEAHKLDEEEHEHEHHHHHHDHDDGDEDEHEHEHHHHDDDDDDDDEHEHEHHHHDHDDDDDDEHEHEHHHDHDEDEDEHEHEHHHDDHDEDEEEHEHHHDEHEHHHHHHHHADDVFSTWGKETPHKFEKATIENALKAFADTTDYGSIIRSKGIVPCVDGSWIYFDFVDGDYELRTGDPDYTGRLVVIGADLKEHNIEELFGL